MTIRRWNENKDSLVQDRTLHVVSGHTGEINCFLNILDLLLSGSKDKTVMAWKNTTLYAKKSFPSEIIQLI